MSDLSDLSPEFIASVGALRSLAQVEKWSAERWNRMVDLLVEDPCPEQSDDAASLPGAPEELLQALESVLSLANMMTWSHEQIATVVVKICRPVAGVPDGVRTRVQSDVLGIDPGVNP